MLEFKLIIELPDNKEVFVAPQYLPSKPNKNIKLILSSFQNIIQRYVFKGFIHRSIVMEFFSKYGKSIFYNENTDTKNKTINKYYYWRNGVILKGKEAKDLVLIQFINHGGSSIHNNSLNEKNILPPHKNKTDEKEANYLAYIEVSVFQGNKKTTFVSNIIKTLDEICNDWPHEKMVSSNNTDLIPLTLLKQYAENKIYFFSYNNKTYELKDFAEYVESIKKPLKVFISYASDDINYLKNLKLI